MFTDISKVLGNFFPLMSSYLNNKIATGFEYGLHVDVVSIELQKAFNTVNHDILIKKMESIGFFKETTKRFKFNLSNRKLWKFKLRILWVWKLSMRSSLRIYFRTTSFCVIYKWYDASCWLWTVAKCWWLLFDIST